MRQQTAQRTGTEVRVEALVGQCRQRLVRPRQRDLDLLLEAVAEALEHDGRDVLDLLLLEGLEHDDVIDTVEEFRTEVILEDLLDRALRLFVALVEDLMRAEVRGHDDDRILEVDHTALAIRQAAIVEDLQQHVEDIAMRFLDLIEQDDAVRTTAHSLGELAALIVADVSRRRANEARYAVLLHVLRHIDADHAALIIEECLSKGLRELRLADTRRAEEDERTDWAVRILDAGACAQDGLADGLDGFILTDDAGVQHIFEMQQLLALARQHLRHRDARPAADDLCDILFADFFFEQAVVLGLRRNDGLFFLELLLELWQLAVLEFRHAVEVVGALGGFHLAVHAVNLFLDGADAQDGVLLRLPLGLELALLLLEFLLLLRDLLELLLGGFIRLLLQGLLLDLQLHDLTADLIERLRHGFDLRAQLCRGFIDEVDGLIRQETV